MGDETGSEKSDVTPAFPSPESTPEADTRESDDEQRRYESGNDDGGENSVKEKIVNSTEAASEDYSAEKSISPVADNSFQKDSDDDQKGYESDNDDAGKSGLKKEESVSDNEEEKEPNDVAEENVNENEDKKEANETDDNEDKGSPSKRQRVVMSSDDEEDDVEGASLKNPNEDSDTEQGEAEGEVAVGELMTNIFGEESDEEDYGESGRHDAEASGEANEGSPHAVREEVEEEEDDGRIWDFDVMLQEKKAERKKTRRRRKDGSIYVGGDMDEQIKSMIDAMKAAAKDDRHCNMEQKPALHKRKMLKSVKALLIKHDYMEAIIDNGMMNAVSEWLAPLPDKSLPALEIRAELLRILQGYGRLEPGTLKQSGLGRAVMLLFKHPRETPENKRLAQNLLREWARPIFQLETDFSTMTKDERVQRDYAQQPEAKKRRLSSAEGHERDKDSEPRPGDKGFIIRARVPRPSQKDYVVRPKSNVEGQFHGATKSRQNSRYDRAQREFRERNKQSRNMRAMKVSIEGRRMDI